jgi:hypothetical protein
LTIFDLPAIDPAEALALASATIAAHPSLDRIYDQPFLVGLIRRRSAYDNVLLLRLVQPDDEINRDFWNGVTADLLTLEAEGSFETFRPKLRRHEGPWLESARTELWFPAWLKRQGVGIALEPQVSARRCEFVAGTAPRTWWEIKSPLDLPELQRDDAVQTDVHRRLRIIDQPYILSLQKFDLNLEQVPNAVKAIKRQIATFHSNGGQPPHLFEADGLVVSADAFSKEAKGHLGFLMGKPYVFGNENTVHVVKRVIEATDQIPREGGGIVVIDRTAADWISHEDVVNACYGEDRAVVREGQWLEGRLPGLFDENASVRISAVVSYTRRWLNDAGTTMTLLHNPSALVELSAGFLACAGVRHTRRVAEGRGFRLETLPP